MTGYVTAFFPKTHHKAIKRNIASTGVFYLRKDSVAAMKANFGVSKFELDRDGFPYLLEKEIPIKTVFNVGFVKDIGTVDRIESARKEWQNRSNWQVPKKTIFLDRDGVIIDNLDNKADPKALRIIPGFEKAIEIFRTLDFKIYVTTNQPGLAKGFFDWDALELIHGSIDSVLSTRGLFLDGWLVCPHHPESGFSGEVQALKIVCRCRKPKTLMFESVLRNQPIDKNKSWLVGDGMSDLFAADNFGINFAGINSSELKNSEASMLFATLLDFAEYISYLDNVNTK
jgi:histidinol-phosphate phosphatase family protein